MACPVSADNVADLLAQLGGERTAALAAARQANVQIAGLLPEAREAGIPVRVIMGYTGMSRQGIYDLLAKSAP